MSPVAKKIARKKPTRSRRQSNDPLERYDTPAWMTRALIEHVPAIQHCRTILEPAAGAGLMVDVLDAMPSKPVVHAFDIEPRQKYCVQADTSTEDFFRNYRHGNTHGGPFALVTNGAFSLNAHYWKMGHLYFDVVALLVRISWLEVTDDRNDLPDPKQMIILPRGRFSGPGVIDPETGKPKRNNDMVTVCWILGGRGFARSTPPIIRVPKSARVDSTAE